MENVIHLQRPVAVRSAGASDHKRVSPTEAQLDRMNIADDLFLYHCSAHSVWVPNVWRCQMNWEDSTLMCV